jgi:hypothetical protein
VQIHGRQRDDTHVDDDLGDAGLVRRGGGPEAEHADIPQRHRQRESGEEPVDRAPMATRQRDDDEREIQEQGHERKREIQRHRAPSTILQQAVASTPDSRTSTSASPTFHPAQISRYRGRHRRLFRVRTAQVAVAAQEAASRWRTVA